MLSKNKLVGFCLFLVGELMLAGMIYHTPTSEFSQNILKTFVFLILALLPFYLFILVYRFSRRILLVASVKQVAWFIAYALGIFIFASLSDQILALAGQDISRIAGNLFTMVSLVIYLVMQHTLLIKPAKEQLVGVFESNQLH